MVGGVVVFPSHKKLWANRDVEKNHEDGNRTRNQKTIRQINEPSKIHIHLIWFLVWYDFIGTREGESCDEMEKDIFTTENENNNNKNVSWGNRKENNAKHSLRKQFSNWKLPHNPNHFGYSTSSHVRRGWDVNSSERTHKLSKFLRFRQKMKHIQILICNF